MVIEKDWCDSHGWGPPSVTGKGMDPCRLCMAEEEILELVGKTTSAYLQLERLRREMAEFDERLKEAR